MIHPRGARSEDANQEGMTLGNNHNQSLYPPKGCKVRRCESRGHDQWEQSQPFRIIVSM